MKKFISTDNLLLAYDYFFVEKKIYENKICQTLNGEQKFSQEELQMECRVLYEEWQERIALMKARFGVSDVLRIFAHLNRSLDGSSLEIPNTHP